MTDNNYIFEFPDVWHIILDYLTDGSFLLNDSRENRKNSHTLVNLRATCRAARQLIAPPDHMKCSQLAIIGATIENQLLCDFAIHFRGANHDIVLSDALNIASTSETYMDAAKFILDHNKIQHYNTKLVIAAASFNRIDICDLILQRRNERERNSRPMANDYEHYSCVAQGAAQSDRKEVFDYAMNNRPIDFQYVMIGGIIGNHAQYCEIALNNGVFPIQAIPHIISNNNVSMCAWLHERVLADIGAEFYEEIIKCSTTTQNPHFVKLVVQWVQETHIIPNCTNLLIYVAQHPSYSEDSDYTICKYLLRICKICNAKIDYARVFEQSMYDGFEYKLKMLINIALLDGYSQHEIANMIKLARRKPVYRTDSGYNIGDIAPGNIW